MSILRVNTLQNTSGVSSMSTEKITGGGYYMRQVQAQVDINGYSFTTSWSLGPAFTGLTGCLANSLIHIEYHMPCRNDSTSWGGLYIEPQVQLGGTWYSAGSSGYDGNIMNNASADIGSYFNSILLNPGIATTYSIGVRFYGKAYDGTSYINSSHDINSVSGTATNLTGTNFIQHYSKIIIKELAPIL